MGLVFSISNFFITKMSLANKWMRKKNSDFMKISQPLNLYEMTLAAAVTCTSFGTWKFRTFQNFGKYTRPRECREEHSFQWVSKELKFRFESLLLQLPKLKKRSRSTKKFWWLLEVLLSSLKNLLNMFLDFLTPLAPYGRTTKPWLKSAQELLVWLPQVIYKPHCCILLLRTPLPQWK